MHGYPVIRRDGRRNIFFDALDIDRTFERFLDGGQLFFGQLRIALKKGDGWNSVAVGEVILKLLNLRSSADSGKKVV